MVGQLWEAGISEIFVNGSFVEDKDHPGDIDGYFECEVLEVASGRLQRKLNELDPYKVWTWDPRSRRPYKNQPKWQLPMWHRYRVQLYPHYPELPQPSGIKDEFGNDLQFPAAFRKSRREHKPKGIVKVVRREAGAQDATRGGVKKAVGSTEEKPMIRNEKEYKEARARLERDEEVIAAQS